uniref:autotransporter family protein n=1 Tax=Fusobacterium sp. TaxID=68766 RepID=UPI00260D40D3
DEIASIGMATNGGSATNNGKITSNTSYSQGLFAFNNGHIINGDNGNIAINGDNVEAMSVSGNGNATNNGKIWISGNKARGMEIDGGTGINNGTIDVHGNGAIGMAAYENSSITNDSNGIINVGEGAIGMVASGTNASAINKGIIKVTSKAEGGMRAFDGGTIDNQGIIKVDVNHVGNKENIAIFADNNSTLINKGKIETNGNVIIESNATYIIGNDSKGNFGKLISKDVKLDGNLLISTEIVKGSYQNSYVFDDIVKSENIEFGENYRSLSSSILYDVKTSKDENGNLDGQLIRNTNTLSKFTNKQFYKVGDLFDKYLDKNKYATLSKQEQDLVDKVFSSTNSPYKINDTIEKLSGKEYLNIPQQIFDIKDNFIKYDNSIIATLDKYNYNFTLIGEYQDIQTKEATIGYDSKMSGFTGAVKLSDNLYGTLGYSYTNIDYNNNSKGNIQTIHSSLYKDYNYNNFKTKYGLFGEFNFHETDRVGIENNIKTDYNSYIVGINGEISKKFGKDLYIQPKISLDISYGKLKEFKDENTLKIKDQNYNSVLPKFEITAGKKFNHIELFTKSSYSYEFGNLDKDMDIEILRKDLSIENTSSNREKIDISVGSNINFDNVSFNIQAGKEFGKRDRNYISAGINYKF